MFDYSVAQWIWLGIAAFSVGVSKMGLSAVVMLVIPIFASVFGGKESTGLLLPMLLAGDIMAVVYYRRHIEVKAITRLLFWVCVGLGLGLLIGNQVNDDQFKMIIGISVVLCMSVLVFTEWKGMHFSFSGKPWFYALVGIIGGFTSMVGNAAGPIITIYLFALGFPKERYIGTYAWFFLIVNLIKMPLQIFVWHNIQMDTMLSSLIMLPVIVAGAVFTAAIIKKINEKAFRNIIIVMTFIAAFLLFI